LCQPEITLRTIHSLTTRTARFSSGSGNSYSAREGIVMPEKETLERAQEDAREGKSPSTQAGEFVREEMHHIREGKHGAASTKQAIAIGLSKARRAGVKLQTPPEGTTSSKTREQATRDRRRAKSTRKPSVRRSRATSAALKRQGHSAASKKSLASQARSAAKKRSSSARHASAMKAVRTKKKQGRIGATQKAGRTRRAA
jgi:Family of unknown function (DUF6496)